jgi:nicotinamidase/pyrazinamidase
MLNPTFFDEKKIGQLYVPNIQAVKAEAAKYLLNMKPSVKDKPGERVAILAIDCQIDFCLKPPIGNLYVDNAEIDMFNIITFILKNMDKITTIYPTLDTHLVFQIFYGYWWVDEKGNHPAPYTPITSADVETGIYKPVIEPIWSLDYIKALEKQTNKPLMIWPEHTMLGTPGHAIVPALYEIFYYHAALRRSQISFQIKGDVAETEMYGIFSPEVKVPKNPRGGINTGFLNLLGKYDKLITIGEASSHCVLESLLQSADFFKDQPEILKKIFVFEDCMSPVKHPTIDFAAMTKAAFEILKKKGLNIVKSTDNIFN